jgi:hypothetical protein
MQYQVNNRAAPAAHHPPWNTSVSMMPHQFVTRVEKRKFEQELSLFLKQYQLTSMRSWQERATTQTSLPMPPLDNTRTNCQPIPWCLLPLPRAGTKVLAISNDLPDRSLSAIHRSGDDSRAPVLRHRCTRKQDAEKEDDVADSKTDIQRCGGDVVVLHPPTTVGIADPLVEDEAD